MPRGFPGAEFNSDLQLDTACGCLGFLKTGFISTQQCLCSLGQSKPLSGRSKAPLVVTRLFWLPGTEPERPWPVPFLSLKLGQVPAPPRAQLRDDAKSEEERLSWS